MKSKEQIEAAQSLISNTQDFIELAKVEKKLKISDHKSKVSKMIDSVEAVIKSKVGEI
ncbi:MAG: hypothetical protein ACI4R8_01220 [Candidatus Caccovivens sp.]